MNTSQQIDLISASLAKAQGEFESAKKATKNEFFHSKYADLAEVWYAVREALSKNELAVIQTPFVDYSKGSTTVNVTTRLVHSSGQFFEETLTLMPVKSDPQGVGSAITYARRYALAAIAGIAQDDDDGNAASGNKPNANANNQQTPNNKTYGQANQKQEPAKETAKEPAKTPATNTDPAKTNSQANAPATKTPSGKPHSGHVWTLEEVNNAVTPELVTEASRIKAKSGFVRESFNKHDGDQAAILKEWKLIPTPQAQKAA